MKKIIKKYRIALSLLLVAGIVYFFSLPSPLFNDPYSTVLDDHQGNLLSAFIARDGQWRFPFSTAVPAKFSAALLLTEDKRFYHYGVDILALARAIRQNARAGKVVSGGSTLSMPVIRFSRKINRALFLKNPLKLF